MMMMMSSEHLHLNYLLLHTSNQLLTEQLAWLTQQDPNKQQYCLLLPLRCCCC
jgi:hypothetical protein